MARYGVYYDKLSDSWAMCIDGNMDRPVKNFKTQGEAMRYASALNDGEEAMLCVVCGKAKVQWPFSTCDECISKMAEQDVYGGAGGTKRLAKEVRPLLVIKNLDVWNNTGVYFTCGICGKPNGLDTYGSCAVCADAIELAKLSEADAAAVRRERMGKPLPIKRTRMTNET